VTSHIISWLPTGRAFTIHNKTKFCSEILPKHFNNIKYHSFVRTLKRWGFVAMTTRRGSKPTFCHPSFIEGDTGSCRKMGPVIQEEDIPASRQQRNMNFVPEPNRRKVSGIHSGSSNSSALATITPPIISASFVLQSSTAPPSLDGRSDSTAAKSSRGMLCLPHHMSGNVQNAINTNQDTTGFSSQLHQQVQAHYQASLQQAIASIDIVLSNARNKSAVSRD
jgi:hypothetical protein